MKLKSFAKLNLSLRIIGRLKNKLHNIQSCVCLINVHDEIKITKRTKRKNHIFFLGTYAKKINKTKNSIKLILDYLKKKKLIRDYYNVKVKKKIPIGSGLGGGSSNAATITKYLINKSKINLKLIDDLSNVAGSDFRLFFYNQTYLKDLKNVKKLRKSHKFYFLLVYPKIISSSKLAYKKVMSFSKKNHKDFSNITNREIFLKELSKEPNDLQKIILKKYPILKKIITLINSQTGCKFARLTGSGSACFGIFKDFKYATKAKKKIKKQLKNSWIRTAKTI